jgi:L,D-peptidoglycan transpeptidase YkuD (ErfK/YbiS/YcfS/YnhG family)
VRRRRTFAVALLVAVTAGAVMALSRGGTAPGGLASAAPLPQGTAPVIERGPQLTPTTHGLGQVARLWPRTLASVPAGTSKAVVVRGDGPTAATATIELYVAGAGGWVRTGAWRGHLGARGWTTDHREGDLRTPVGTFTLSDAGGRLADPGTQLPYHHSTKFVPSGSSVFGDSLEGSFDYVIAIDYNRRLGVSPLDATHPLGDARGGGIWLHVDHDGPTHGCVSVPREGMVALLRGLSPSDHPVVVMGDKARLAT